MWRLLTSSSRRCSHTTTGLHYHHITPTTTKSNHTLHRPSHHQLRQPSNPTHIRPRNQPNRLQPTISSHSIIGVNKFICRSISSSTTPSQSNINDSTVSTTNASPPTSTASTTTMNDSDQESPNDPYLIRQLNHAIRNYPVETIGSLMLLEMTSMTLTKQFFSVMDIQFPTLFAVAFVLSMPIRRSFLPKLTVAFPMMWILKRLAPSLAKVQLSRLAPSVLFAKKQTTELNTATVTPKRFNSYTQNLNLPQWLQSTKTSVSSFMTKFRSRFATLSDQYGLALLISYRMAGCIIVNSIYGLLLSGVDIQPLLNMVGYTGDVTKASDIGSYAGAVVFGALWFPFMVFLAPAPARLLHFIRQKLFGKKIPLASATITTAPPSNSPLPSSAPLAAAATHSTATSKPFTAPASSVPHRSFSTSSANAATSVANSSMPSDELEVNLMVGNAQLQLSHFVSADQHFSQIIETLSPHSLRLTTAQKQLLAKAHYGRAILLSRELDEQLCLTELKTAIQLDPTYQEAIEFKQQIEELPTGRDIK